MASDLQLIRKRKRLTQRIHENLDFLVGSVSSKSMQWPAYNLTTKVEGKTKSRHIPKDMVPLVRRLVKRHQKLKDLLRDLAEVNWELIKRGIELTELGQI